MKDNLANRKSGTRDPGPLKWDPGPAIPIGSSGTGSRDPPGETGTRDPKIFRWDPGPGTPEVRC